MTSPNDCTSSSNTTEAISRRWMSAEIAITASVISAPREPKRNPADRDRRPVEIGHTRAGDLAALGRIDEKDRDIERPLESAFQKEMRTRPV